MNVIFTTTDTALFIDTFFAPRFDQHVRAFRHHQFAVAVAAQDADSRWDAAFASLRDARARSLFAEG